MSYDQKFTQTDYSLLVVSLDNALSVFQRTAQDPDAAFKDFVLNHYFKVWRAMARPPTVTNGDN